MKLALLFGEKGSLIRDRLLNVRDNLVINTFDSVEELVANSVQRNYLFDRILILSTPFTLTGTLHSELQALHDYWVDYASKTSVVFLCSTGKDDANAKDFANLFNSPICTSMAVKAATVPLIVESITSNISELNTKYGVQPDMMAEAEVYEIPVQEEVVEQPAVPSAEELRMKRKAEKQARHENRRLQREEKKKNKQNGKSFFGRGNKNKGVVDNTDTQNQSYDINEEDSTNSYEAMSNEDLREDTYTDEVSQVTTDYQDSTSEYGNEDDDIGDSYIEDSGFDDSEDSEISDDNQQFASSDVVSESESDFSEDSDNIEEDYVDEGDTSFDVEEEGTSDIPQGYDDEDMILEDDYSDEEEADYEEDTSEEYADAEEDIEEDLEDYYDEDVKSASSVNSYIQNNEVEKQEFRSSVPRSQKPIQQSNASLSDDAEEIDLSIDTIDVSSMDSQYRTKRDTPKVIEKEVIKEKVVHVGGGVIDNVLKGNTSKIILVTGDRGSGLTTTALDIAKEFAKHVPVLYFDGDVETHGLLNYIDYEEFREYQSSCMQGVKLCRTAKAFYNNCVIRFDDNFDILSTNYGVVVSDEELEEAQSVVAEIAHKYGVVVVDAPIDKIDCFKDLILQGNTVLCVEASKRGFMNMLCKVEDSSLPLRYKRCIVGKGTMVVTKVYPKLDMKGLLKYIKNIVEVDEIDWLSMHMIPREATISKKFLSEIIEG